MPALKDFEQKEVIFSTLNQYISKNSYVFIGVSGGPDSMFLFYLVKDFFVFKKIPYKNIFVLHYNHGVRKESDEEEEYLRSYFSEYNFVSEKSSFSVKSEEELREARYSFFSQKVSEIGGEENYLCLGHNLTDRIETSFINILRGSSLEGFMNMSFFSQKMNNLNLLRPLIYLPKDYIKSLCKDNLITYFEDKTNLDVSFSKRNYIRHNIISQLEDNSHQDKNGKILFYESLKNLYESIERLKNSQEASKYYLLPMRLSCFWRAQLGYRVFFNELSFNSVALLLRDLGLYNLSKRNIQEVFEYLSKSSGGYKYIGGIYFFSLHGIVYAVRGEKFFRKKTVETEKVVEYTGEYKIGDFNIDITEESLKGAVLRFRKRGDKYKGKSLSKYFINKKIPFFWRNFIPVIEKDGKIMKVLDFKYLA